MLVVTGELEYTSKVAHSVGHLLNNYKSRQTEEMETQHIGEGIPALADRIPISRVLSYIEDSKM